MVGKIRSQYTDECNEEFSEDEFITEPPTDRVPRKKKFSITKLFGRGGVNCTEEKKPKCTKACCNHSSEDTSAFRNSRSRSPNCSDRYENPCDSRASSPCTKSCCSDHSEKMVKKDSTRSLPACNSCTFQTCKNPECKDHNWAEPVSRSRSADSKNCKTANSENLKQHYSSKTSHDIVTCTGACCKDHNKQQIRSKSAEPKGKRSESETCLSSYNCSSTKQGNNCGNQEFNCKSDESSRHTATVTSVSCSDESKARTTDTSNVHHKIKKKKCTINISEFFVDEAQSSDWKRFASCKKPDWYDTSKPLRDSDLEYDECQEKPKTQPKKKEKCQKKKVGKKSWSHKRTSKTKVRSEDAIQCPPKRNVSEADVKANSKKKKPWYSFLICWSGKKKGKCYCGKANKREPNHKCISFEDDRRSKNKRKHKSESQTSMSSQNTDECPDLNEDCCNSNFVDITNQRINLCSNSPNDCQQQQQQQHCYDTSGNSQNNKCDQNAPINKDLWTSGVVPKFPWTLMSSSWVHGQDKSTRVLPYRCPKYVYNPTGVESMSNSNRDGKSAFQNFYKYKTANDPTLEGQSAATSGDGADPNEEPAVEVRIDELGGNNV